MRATAGAPSDGASYESSMIIRQSPASESSMACRERRQTDTRVRRRGQLGNGRCLGWELMCEGGRMSGITDQLGDWLRAPTTLHPSAATRRPWTRARRRSRRRKRNWLWLAAASCTHGSSLTTRTDPNNSTSSLRRPSCSTSSETCEARLRRRSGPRSTTRSSTATIRRLSRCWNVLKPWPALQTIRW